MDTSHPAIDKTIRSLDKTRRRDKTIILRLENIIPIACEPNQQK